MTRFVAELCPKKTRFAGGYASGSIDPGTIADSLGFGTVSGEWLTCYMLRRFGWSNVGSDSHKNLCTWCLTTPIAGLFLTVTPHLGGGSGRSLHFGVRFDKAAGEALERNPGRDAFTKRSNRAILAWWLKHGSEFYAMGESKPGEDVLVNEYAPTEDGKVWGLWKRPEGMKRQGFPRGADAMLFWWLGQFIKQAHPEVKLPTPNKRERVRVTAFHRRANAALKATLRDLLRPVRVSDISFSPAGRGAGEGAEAAPFEGAGFAPEYWFKTEVRARRQAAMVNAALTS